MSVDIKDFTLGTAVTMRTRNSSTGLVTGNETPEHVLLSQAVTSIVTFTCGTTAYAAQDAVGVGSGSAVLSLPSIGPSGALVQCVGSLLEIDAAAIISGETSYSLYLYGVTPPSALADSAAWDVPSGDRSAFLDYLNVGTPIDLGSTLFVSTQQNKVVRLTGTGLFGYLVSNGAYTPTARVFKLTTHWAPVF